MLVFDLLSSHFLDEIVFMCLSGEATSVRAHVFRMQAGSMPTSMNAAPTLQSSGSFIFFRSVLCCPGGLLLRPLLCSFSLFCLSTCFLILSYI